jgi:hypothetical protein
MHDSSRCDICRGKPVGDSLSDAEFSAFLASCRRQSALKQREFAEEVQGASRWDYDMDNQTLSIGSVVYGMTPIGTYSPDHKTWLWAWANDAFPAAAREGSAEIQVLHGTTGFRVFIDPGIPCSAKDADDLVALAVHALDARAFFRCPSNDPTLFLAVHEPRSAG